LGENDQPDQIPEEVIGELLQSLPQSVINLEIVTYGRVEPNDQDSPPDPHLCFGTGQLLPQLESLWISNAPFGSMRDSPGTNFSNLVRNMGSIVKRQKSRLLPAGRSIV
jgi:hypothetical protein